MDRPASRNSLPSRDLRPRRSGEKVPKADEGDLALKTRTPHPRFAAPSPRCGGEKDSRWESPVSPDQSLPRAQYHAAPDRRNGKVRRQVTEGRNRHEGTMKSYGVIGERATAKDTRRPESSTRSPRGWGRPWRRRVTHARRTTMGIRRELGSPVRLRRSDSAPSCARRGYTTRPRR